MYQIIRSIMFILRTTHETVLREQIEQLVQTYQQKIESLKLEKESNEKSLKEELKKLTQDYITYVSEAEEKLFQKTQSCEHELNNLRKQIGLKEEQIISLHEENEKLRELVNYIYVELRCLSNKIGESEK